MARIFISYSRKDARLVDRLIAALEGAGHDVWVDRSDLRGGEQWRRQIVTAIDGADFFLLILSPHSVKSDNVRKELDLAESVKKRVLPLVVKPVSIPQEMRYQLVGLQRLDLSADFEAGLDQLLLALAGDGQIEPRVPRSSARPRGINRIIVVSATLALVVLILGYGIFKFLVPNREETAPTPAGGGMAGVTATTEPTTTPDQSEDTVEPTPDLQTAIETAVAKTRQAEARAAAAAESPTPTATAIPPSPTATPLPPPPGPTPTSSPTAPVPTPTPIPAPPATPTPDLGFSIDDFEGSGSSLEGDFEINRNVGNDGQLTLVGLPHVSQGRQALAFAFDIRNSPPDHYIGFNRVLVPQDWSGFSALCFWIESDGSNRSLVLQFGESKLKFYKQVFSLSNGTGDYCLSLDDPHQLNLRSIGYYGVYVEGPPTGQSVIYIDDVRLVN